MKRRDLIRELEKIGCVLLRHGGNHDWYHNPETRISQPVPRHREIKVRFFYADTEDIEQASFLHTAQRTLNNMKPLYDFLLTPA